MTRVNQSSRKKLYEEVNFDVLAQIASHFVPGALASQLGTDA